MIEIKEMHLELFENCPYKIGSIVKFGGEDYKIVDHSLIPYEKFDDGSEHYVLSIAKCNGTVDDWAVINDAQLD